MAYILYWVGMVLLLLLGILAENPFMGVMFNFSNLYNFFDLPTALFIAIPCILLVWCTHSGRDIVNAFLLLFDKGDPSLARCRGGLCGLQGLVRTAFACGALHAVIVLVNTIGTWDSSTGLQTLLAAGGLSLFSFFYPLVLWLALLPVCGSLSRRLACIQP